MAELSPLATAGDGAIEAGFALPIHGRLPTMDVERRTFGELLRYHRKRKGYSQDTLAERLSTTKDRVSNYENNKIRPEHDRLMKLITELEIPAIAALRAIGYPIETSTRTWKDLLAEDENLDDAGRAMVEHLIELEYERAERREKPPAQTKRTRRAG